MRKLVLVIALVTLAPFALAACGGDDDDEEAAAPTRPTTQEAGGGGGGGGETLSLAADPSQLAFDTTSLSAKTGSLTIDFDNPNSSIPHDVCIESPQGDDLGCSDTVTGDSTSQSFDLSDAGDYTFYCSVDGHREAGMEGTLTVQ
jgi:plastocyanin